MSAVERMLVVTRVLAQKGVFALKGVIVLAGVLVAKGMLVAKGVFAVAGVVLLQGGPSVIFCTSFPLFVFAVLEGLWDYLGGFVLSQIGGGYLRSEGSFTPEALMKVLLKGP